MAERALRVLGVAYLDVDVLPNEINSNNIENNLVFIGFIGMIDPPRKGVKESVKACRRAIRLSVHDSDRHHACWFPGQCLRGRGIL